MSVTIADLRAAAARIGPFVRRTPVLTDVALDQAVGASVFVKAECLQVIGAFKARGAFNKIASLSPEERARGLLAFSSGNHAQAVAAAARQFGVPALIVMPSDAPAVKIEGTHALGAEIVLYDRLSADREALGASLLAERGMVLVKPFDDAMIIAGQGTAALELVEDAGAMDVLAAPASGGGLVSGSAIAARHANPAARVYAVEPEGHDDFARSLAAGSLVANAPGVRTFCDGLMSPTPGALPLALSRELLAGAVAVSDGEVANAMRFAFRRLKIVLEPSGAAGLAALLAGKIDAKGARIGVIATGGNVDAALFAQVLAAA